MRTALLPLLLIGSLPLAAQDAAPAARTEDVATIDGIIAALYEVVSGPAGAERDWARMQTIFAPDARMIPTGRRPDGSGARLTWSFDDYRQRVGPQLKEGGFFEREIGRRTDRFGSIAQVFSTYESRRKADDPEPFMRGINSIQLWHDGARWWVLSVYWENESPTSPIPAAYLQRSGSEG